jgi:hypothetical protein
MQFDSEEFLNAVIFKLKDDHDKGAIDVSVVIEQFLAALHEVVVKSGNTDALQGLSLAISDSAALDFWGIIQETYRKSDDNRADNCGQWNETLRYMASGMEDSISEHKERVARWKLEIDRGE